MAFGHYRCAFGKADCGCSFSDDYITGLYTGQNLDVDSVAASGAYGLLAVAVLIKALMNCKFRVL